MLNLTSQGGEIDRLINSDCQLTLGLGELSSRFVLDDDYEHVGSADMRITDLPRPPNLVHAECMDMCYKTLVKTFDQAILSKSLHRKLNWRFQIL